MLIFDQYVYVQFLFVFDPLCLYAVFVEFIGNVVEQTVVGRLEPELAALNVSLDFLQMSSRQLRFQQK